jgi:plasminogen activator inhibitor 1 RNA-binding protein
MTLEEYEKVLEEKRKALEDSKSEGRKVTAEVFEGMQLLEKKKLDDENASKKAENEQRKEPAKQVKAPKVTESSLQQH